MSDETEGRIKRLSDAIHGKLGYYVYRLVDPRDGSTFYIGKGKGKSVAAPCRGGDFD